jgi:phosphohistidine phosphatase SixA
MSHQATLCSDRLPTPLAAVARRLSVSGLGASCGHVSQTRCDERIPYSACSHDGGCLLDMQIVFIRHGARERTSPLSGRIEDKDRPLSQQGEAEVAKLKRLMGEVGLQPTRCFSSKHVHAMETAQLLFGDATPASMSQVVELDCLTPKNENKREVDAFIDDSRARGFANTDVVLVVGHEPRLGQLLTKLTARRVSPIGRAGAVCVRVASPAQLLLGKAEVEWRSPVDVAGGTDLTEKLSAKMSVSATLAGLTITAAAILLEGGSVTVWRTAALLLLTAGVALLVASLYIYDRLLMPEAFWSAAESGRSLKLIGRKSFRDDRNANGVLYAEMVWTWRYIFSPGLFFAALGYLAMLGDLQGRLPAAVCSTLPLVLCNRAALVVGTAIVIMTTVYYYLARPRLGVD